MRYGYFALSLFAVLLIGCATTEIPQLGQVDKGRYYDAAGRFACPLPAQAQGFNGLVRVVDAVASGDGFVPASRIEFIDTLQPARRIAVSFRPLTANADAQHADFDAEGSGRIAIGSTALHQLPLDYAMLLVPYQQPGNARPPELHLLANFVIPLEQDAGKRHVQLRDSRAVTPLLPEMVDPADGDAVMNAMRRSADSLRDTRTETFDWLRQCYWSTESRSQ